MPTIYVSINNRRESSQVVRQPIVRENNDYIVQFEFAESSGFTEAGLKSALFVTSRGMQERYFVGNSCVAPMFTKEDGNYLRVGVVEGEIRTTTSAYISIVDSVISGHETDLDAPLPTTPLVDTLNPSDRVKVFIPSTGAVGAATIEQIRDGAGGGSDGHSPYIGENGNWFEYDDSTGEYVDTEVHAQGEQGEQGEPGADGADGAPGATGATGTTFTPSVSNEGVLSWTNDGGKQNPSPVNIKGPQGEPGVTPAAYDSNPEMDGVASAGSSTAYARGDHVHPSDTTKQSKFQTTTLTIAVADWETGDPSFITTYFCGKQVNGMTNNALVFYELSDPDADIGAYNVLDGMVFGTDTLPASDITVKVAWFV